MNRITRGDTVVQLEHRAMNVLLVLASHAGEVVSRYELQDAVWQTEFVADNTLVKRIAQVREALGDDAKHPRYIETIPKRGYRLLAEVAAPEATAAGAELPDELPASATGERPPYPGLAPYDVADADDFFGRDAEIAALWRRIVSRRLLAVIGASGAGKSSLLRAGVIARAPLGWRAVVCQPGEEPFHALARALAPDVADDSGEMLRLLSFRNVDVALAVVSRWRGRWDDALIVIDQFEELFTLNPEPVRVEFIDLLRRLVDGAGIHLVLVLRDDFLLECHRYRQLAPIFGELTAVGPPTGRELREALTEPAARRLVGFESELLVDEMVAEVEAERGALPLLAFAMSRLWELRDRERRLLTRDAYEQIGGVGGALAQHAEETLDAIGSDRRPFVRELFRNLVTAQGTRAVRGVDDLLSVFDEGSRVAARSVLAALIDARLLTSFDDRADEPADGATRHRVEIVHESLLAAWPRLVRWRTQDADAAQLRDQFRQAAQLWNARGKPDGLLWTGTSYREFRLWRERYSGGLTRVEEEFASALTACASRRRRRRRTALGTLVASIIVVAAVTTMLWQRSARETRRAEANALFRTGQSIVDKYPHGALGAALASLELVDDVEVRRFAVQALQRGPKGHGPKEETPPMSVQFSPDGVWLATGSADGSVRLYHQSGGEPRRTWTAHDGAALVYFGSESSSVGTIGLADGHLRWWSVPGGELIDDVKIADAPVMDRLDPAELGVVRNLIHVVPAPAAGVGNGAGWTLDPEPLRVFLRLREGGEATSAALDPRQDRLAIIRGKELALLSLDIYGARPRLIGRSDEVLERVAFHPDGARVAAVSASGRAMMWKVDGGQSPPIRTWRPWRQSAFWNLRFDPTGSYLFASDESGNTIVWGMDDPPDADPLQTITGMDRQVDLAFHPDGRWFVHTATNGFGVYPFDRGRYGWVLRGHTANVEQVAFDPDGAWLVSASLDGTVRLWAVRPSSIHRSRVLISLDGVVSEHLRMDVAPDGRFVAVTSTDGAVLIVPVDGSAHVRLVGLEGGPTAVAVSPDSRVVAAAGGGVLAGDRATIRTWDLGAASSQLVDHGLPGPVRELHFTTDGSLLASDGHGALRRYDLNTGASTLIAQGVYRFEVTPDGERIVALSHIAPAVGAAALVLDLTTSERTPLNTHGTGLYAVDLHPDGEIVVSGGKERAVRVGDRTGSEPHLLFGNEAMILAVAVSPDGRWVASGGRDATVRMWRVPVGVPVQALPKREFLDRMWQSCDYIYVRDASEPDGFRSVGRPFVGWSVFPE